MEVLLSTKKFTFFQEMYFLPLRRENLFKKNDKNLKLWPYKLLSSKNRMFSFYLILTQ